MNCNKSDCFFFLTTVTVILTCTGLCVYFAGIKHEDEHLKNIMITIVIVLFFQMVIADPIKFILLSIDKACWPPEMKIKKPVEKDYGLEYSRLDFLKRRLRAERIQLIINERYRDDQLNEHYKSITQDLILYSVYFFILTSMVLVTQDEAFYHNTVALQTLFMKNHTFYMGMDHVIQLNQLFDFIQSSLVDAFDYNDGGGNYWIHSEPTKMLSVVRLRQLRLEKEQFGWNDPEYTDTKYMPDWVLPYRQLHYTDKFWRIYEPWLPAAEPSFLDSVLLNFNHIGQFQHYPELKGYISVLARSKGNSMKIMDFLEQYHWLNYNTSAVFLDFTLYNVDASVFSVCTLIAERIPYGSIIPTVNCDSVPLYEALEQKSYLSLIVIVVYLLSLLLLIQSFVANLWYKRSNMRNIWYKIDLVIFVLNVAVIILTVIRIALMQAMLNRLEGANKLEFINFRAATRLFMTTSILIGFLICLTTLRLWKVLQVSKVFEVFTRTFSIAWKALAMTVAVILIILMAFGIAFTIINGNNSYHYIRPLKSLITSLCFACGFRTELKPEEIFHGGRYLGLLMYATLGFVVSILLINVLITTINDYFLEAKKQFEHQSKRRLTYIEFLRVEYFNTIYLILELPCFKKGYKRNDRTVAENIQLELDRKVKSYQMEQNRKKFALASSIIRAPVKDENTLQAEYRENVEHILAVSAIFKIQLQILDLVLFEDIKEDIQAKEEESA